VRHRSKCAERRPFLLEFHTPFKCEHQLHVIIHTKERKKERRKGRKKERKEGKQEERKKEGKEEGKKGRNEERKKEMINLAIDRAFHFSE
jgi:hypothetical protein